MTSARRQIRRSEPAIDDRLAAPESRYEVIDGEMLSVSPADESHATRHARIAALLDAHVDDAYDIAVDMLTRTSKVDDIAPDASVFPHARDPETGSRQLEEMVFEVVSKQRLGDAAKKAAKLAARGVRRIFGIDVEHSRLVAWSVATDTWEILPTDFVIEDRVLSAPLPGRALVESLRADRAIIAALIARGHPALMEMRRGGYEEGRQEGRQEGQQKGDAAARERHRLEMVSVLLRSFAARGLTVDHATRERIESEPNNDVLLRWLSVAGGCARPGDIFSA